MRLSRTASASLVLFGVWTWIIWPVFIKNIWADPRSFHHGPTGFLLVHVALAVVSTIAGTAIAWLGVRGLLASRRAVAGAPEAAGPEAAGPEAAGPEAAGPEAAGPDAETAADLAGRR